MQNVLIGISEIKASIVKEIDKVLKELQTELLQQGHKATGALIESAEQKTAFEDATRLVIDIYFNDYWVYVNNGVAANRIPYTPRRRGEAARGGTSKYIEALISWAKIIGIPDNEAKGFAFAVARKHSMEGMPTRSSYRYSSNGRRTNFLGFVTDGIEERIAAAINLDGIANLVIQKYLS